VEKRGLSDTTRGEERSKKKRIKRKIKEKRKPVLDQDNHKVYNPKTKQHL